MIRRAFTVAVDETLSPFANDVFLNFGFQMRKQLVVFRQPAHSFHKMRPPHKL